MEPVGDLDADRLGEARRLVEARLDVAPALAAAHVGQGDDRRAPRVNSPSDDLLGNAQAAGSSSSCSTKLTGCSGCTVEMACL